MHLVFDIGASNTRIALAQKRLIDPIQLKTPKNFQLFLKKLSEYAKGQRPVGIAGGLPGQFNSTNGRFIGARNLQGWKDIDAVGQLKKKFRCPVALENDAALAGLGEAHYGAGKGKEIVVYYTVSTGINAVRIVDGKIDRKAWGFQIGRQLIDGYRDLESLVGGASLERRYGRAPEDVNRKSVWRKVEKDLSRGVFNSILHWSPHIVVMGGGLIEAKAARVQGIKAELSSIKQKLGTSVPIPSVVASKLGQLAGLHGGMVLTSKL